MIEISKKINNTPIMQILCNSPTQSYPFASSQFLPDPEIFPRMLEMINSSNRELLLISPWIYQDIISESLIMARKRGVIIKLITRKYKNGQDHINHLSTIQKLDMQGIQIAYVNKIHAKILIKDEEELLLSSKNATETNAIDFGIWNTTKNEVRGAREEFYLLYNQKHYDPRFLDVSRLNFNIFERYTTDFLYEIATRKFYELFGPFTMSKCGDQKMFMSKDQVIFCTYPVALTFLEQLGIVSAKVHINQLFGIKINNQRFFLCNYFGALSRGLFNKARRFLDADDRIFLLWSVDDGAYITITDERLALLVRNCNIKIV